VLDAFGHVSMRHPQDPGRFLTSRSQAEEGAKDQRAGGRPARELWKRKAPGK
jgi:hypothetical protein